MHLNFCRSFRGRGDIVEELTDNKIIELYFDRNEDAVKRSQEKYGGYCYTIAYNILDNNEDSEECVNETWLRAWNSIPPKKPSKLGSFFGRISRNIALDKYKSNNRLKRGNGEITAILNELESCIPDSNATEEKVEMKILEDILNNFLKTLSQQDCAVFLSRYWFAMPLKEISKKYSLKESTVKSSLFRSRGKLKNLLEKEEITL